jgi:PAS domain S-box-containing protein
MSSHEPGEPLYTSAGEVDPDVALRLHAEHLLELSEERGRLMQLAPGDVIWSMSPDGRITHVSREVEAMRGLTPEEALRQSLDEILTPASQQISLAYFQALMGTLAAGGKPAAFRGELEYTCKDGTTVLADVQTVPHINAAGELVELLGISRAIS